LVEVSEPKGWFLRPLYMFYPRRCMPIIEKLFLGYSYGFAMIGVYVAEFGDCARLRGHLEEHGLRCELTKYFYGCASGLVGSKPAESQRSAP
jgi:demethylmenaquinone methyltransferase/2-methoxy-6-polyprenyl-1,4-benzoquinol methylase